jgi:hypothetical protein
MRTITWALATDRKVGYNPTYRFNEIQRHLDFMSRYWAIRFVRQTDYASARVKVLNTAQAAVMQSDIGNRVIKISSYFRFGSSYQQCRLLCHEFMHLAGGPAHLGQPHIMATNGGTAGNFTQQDCNFMRAYAWRSTTRPWLQPNAMADAYGVPVRAANLTGELHSDFEIDSEVPACSCKRNWVTAIQQSLTLGPWV